MQLRIWPMKSEIVQRFGNVNQQKFGKLAKDWEAVCIEGTWSLMKLQDMWLMDAIIEPVQVYNPINYRYITYKP